MSIEKKFKRLSSMSPFKRKQYLNDMPDRDLEILAKRAAYQKKRWCARWNMISDAINGRKRSGK